MSHNKRLSLILLFVVFVAAATPVVTPELRARLQRHQELADSPTARMILRLDAIEAAHHDTQVTKRLVKLVDSYRQQVLTLTNHFLVEPVTPHTSLSLTELVLFLAEDDASLFAWYQTRRERRALARHITEYRRLSWPEKGDALQAALTQLSAAKAGREMVGRLRRLSLDQQQQTSDVSQALVATTLRRMRTVCGRKKSGVNLASTIDDYLFLYNGGEEWGEAQRRQIRLILKEWDGACCSSQ